MEKNNNNSIVSNTSPLITLEKMPDGFSFIRKLYNKIIIPEEVLIELSEGQKCTTKEYLSKYDIENLINVQKVQIDEQLLLVETIHLAEALAISLAKKMKLTLLIEEEQGRKVSKANNVIYSGVAGQIRIAYLENLITKNEAIEKLQVITKAGRLPKTLCKSIIEAL